MSPNLILLALLISEFKMFIQTDRAILSFYKIVDAPFKVKIPCYSLVDGYKNTEAQLPTRMFPSPALGIVCLLRWSGLDATD